jgi:hypothetical protein
VKASNTGAGDQFGESLAAVTDTLLVGASHEDSAATGVDGNGADDSAPESGAAYVFASTNGDWAQQAYLKASNTHAGDLFGASVAVTDTTAVVGAPGANNGAGAAYVFVRSGTTWAQQAMLTVATGQAGDGFGVVAISGDTILVGAPGEDSGATDSGAVYVFARSGTVWTQAARLVSPNGSTGTRFGAAVSLGGVPMTAAIGEPGDSSNARGVNGNPNDTSAPGAGGVFLFVGGGAAWSQQAYVKASNTAPNQLFGASVAVSHDPFVFTHDELVVGAVGDASPAAGINGDPSGNTSPGSGAAWVFRRVGTAWLPISYLKAQNPDSADRFGRSVAASTNSPLIVVGADLEASRAKAVDGDGRDNGAPGAGAVYTFE